MKETTASVTRLPQFDSKRRKPPTRLRVELRFLPPRLLPVDVAVPVPAAHVAVVHVAAALAVAVLPPAKLLKGSKESEFLRRK